MSRYQPRDRSPPRFPERDRRPSLSQNAPSTPFVFRSSSDANQIPLGREPPRGPKADVIRHGSQPTIGPRGRGGFGGRPDFRDRDREFRDAPTPFRRDPDRGDWPRRDRDVSNPEREISGSREIRSYVGRDRSASPTRSRRDSRDAPLSQSGRVNEPTSWYAPAVRGLSTRGRIRGDWDRGRGRGLVLGDRDRDRDREVFRARSRSREGWRERHWDRERVRDADGDRRERFERREPDRSLEREEKMRDAGSLRRDRSPGRNSIGSSGPLSLPTNTGASDDTTARASSLERPLGRLYSDSSRRFSTALTPTGFSRESRKDGDKSDYFSTRSEKQVQDSNLSRASSPPSAPQVPAFGLPLDNLKPSAQAAPPAVVAAAAAAAMPSLPVDTPSSTATIAEPLPISSQAPFQPPTGPKADRISNLPAGLPREPRLHLSEPWQKTDISNHVMRPALNTPNSRPTPDLKSGDTRTAIDNRENSSALQAETSPFKGIPTGPRAGTTTHTKTRPTLAQYIPSSTPSVPTIRRAASPVDQRVAAPPSSRMIQPRGSHQWLSLDYKPQQRPSITAPIRTHQGDPRDRSNNFQTLRNSGFNQPQATGLKPRIFRPPHPQPPSKTLLPSGRDEIAMIMSDQEVEDQDSRMSGMAESLEQSSEDEVEDDEALDEDDFAASEEKFLRQMKLLALKKPSPPLENPVIVNLLLRIQMLSMIKHGAVPVELQYGISDAEPEAEPDAEPGSVKDVQPSGLLSPKVEEEKEESPQQIGRRLKEAPKNPIPTPPIEDLPHLSLGMPTELITFDESEDENELGDVARTIQKELEQTAWDYRKKLDERRDEFDDSYREWKIMMMRMDRQKREDNAITPAPASPSLSVGQIPVLTPLIERTRGARNTTELDIQNILRASEQSAREEQEKRDREATARPNYELEALVPPMLDPEEAEMSYFVDTNHLIAPENALDVFAFVPPQDDFTREEQESFINAFCQHPKKWGKISELLPERDYRQCILHYYLTKDVAKYKDYWRKTLPRKGRKKGASSRLRSTALISDMGYDGDELDSTPMALTDSGRPRRAAAPTFGDTVGDPEAPNGTTATSRRLIVPSKDSAGETGSEKPSGRGRKAGAGMKPRRTKAQVQQSQQAFQVASDLSLGTSPVKVERNINHSSKGTKVSSRGSFLASKTDDLPTLGPQLLQEQDLVRSHASTTLTDMPNPNEFSTPPPNQPSSYWSVPEQTKFRSLIAYFGKDFEAISNFMKTKTVTMVKNNYSRQVSDGKNKGLEQLAQEADDRRERGEPMGPPPSPVPPPHKRRIDPTQSGPPANAQRSLAPNGETVTAEDDATILSVQPKPSAIEDFVPPSSTTTLPRSTSNEMAQKSRLQHSSQATLLPHQRVKESTQAPPPQMASQQRHLQGPPSGFFREGRSDPRQPNQPSQGITQQSPLHQSLGRQNERTRPQTLLPQQRPIAAQQVPSVQQHHQNAPRVSSPPSYHQQESSIQHQVIAHMMPARPLNSTTSAPSLQITKQEPDSVPLRRHDPLTQKRSYAQSPAHSPVSMRPQSVVGTPQEPSRPNSTPIALSAEQTRPTPAKRSNIVSLLNDEPAEIPPPKRLSIEQPRIQSIQSPPLSIISNVTTSQQPPTLHRRDDGASLQQSSGPRYQPESNSMINYQQSWINRSDPRISDRPQYAVQSPSTQHHQTNPSQAGLSQSHHQTILGPSLQDPGHVPSPPPQTQFQSSIQSPYRTSATSSHHSRMLSYHGSGQSTTQMSQSTVQPQSGHPHSTLQSPVPGLPRSHAPASLESRNPLQRFETRNSLHTPHTFQIPQQQQHAVQQQQLEQHIQQDQLQLQQQQQQRPMMISGGRYPDPPGRIFTSTPPGVSFTGQGQYPQQQSHQRHFSQEGRMEERK